MSINLIRYNSKKLVLDFEYKLTKTMNRYKADDGSIRDYLDFQTIFPSTLKNFLCSDSNIVYFYKSNDGTIHVTGHDPGSIYEVKKVNIVERSKNQYAIVLPKYLYNDLSNYQNFKFSLDPDVQEFSSGKLGVVTAEPI
ncbi:hypothetical protein [Methanosphaera cuniculi]|uniref:hypothetical protein n=1 Tax=Methanosphaera cuniculi TaxID=1077256 RepID=UPI0026F26DB9|nr:hypothetical protein [Methanosphaera cuniculi]